MTDQPFFRRLGIVEAAKYIGASVTTLRRLMRDGRIAYIDPPRGPKVFDTVDLQIFLSAYRVPRADEIESRPEGLGDVVEIARRRVAEKRGISR